MADDRESGFRSSQEQVNERLINFEEIIRKHGSPWSSITTQDISEENIDILDYTTASGNNVIAFVGSPAEKHRKIDSRRALIRMANPTITNVSAVQVSPETLSKLVEELRNKTASKDEQSAQQTTSITVDQDSDAQKLCIALFTWAAEVGASDLHCEIRPGDIVVARARVNGYMIPYPKNQTVSRPALEAALRYAYNVLSTPGSRTSPSSLPEDDIASAAIEIPILVGTRSLTYMLRFEWSPDYAGPTAVARLSEMGRFREMAQHRGDMEKLREYLTKYGYANDTIEMMIPAIMAKRGLFLVGGVVGSGKTTLLYTIMVFTAGEDSVSRSIEDPIEAELPGVRQSTPGKGQNLASMTPEQRTFHFAKYMKSALRADIDKLLIGEIRGREMAEVARDVVQSGHAGLATLHYGSVFDAVDRLTSPTMGLDIGIVAQENFFRAIMCQELLPVLCECKLTPEAAGISIEYMESVRELYDYHDKGLDISAIRFRNHAGCPKCNKRVPGIISRTVVEEFLEISDVIMTAFRNRDIEKAKRIFRLTRSPLNEAKSKGRTMFENALHKCLKGDVDPRDIEYTLKPFRKAIDDFKLAELMKKESTQWK